jgi:LasA protease
MPPLPTKSRVILSVGILALYLSSLALTACQSPFPSAKISPTPSLRTDTATQTIIQVTPSPSPELHLSTTATRTSPVIPSPSPTSPAPTLSDHLVYYAQSGDTVYTVARRFDVEVEDISSPDPLPEVGFLAPGQMLDLPIYSSNSEPNTLRLSTSQLIPDSEVVYSPSAANFNITAYLNRAGGYLSTHQEYLRSTGWTSAAEIIKRVAEENSINPRLLLSILEYEANCVHGDPDEHIDVDYLVGMRDYHRKGLYLQLGWLASQLSAGFYGWRTGSLIEFQSPDGTIVRPTPDSNAGSVALQYYFAQSMATKGMNDQDWKSAINPENGFPLLHQNMFGDPWDRAQQVEPLFPEGLTQPELSLPFEPGRLWSYTSGPHTVWESEGAQAALDFAPAAAISGCVQSEAWVVAMADGPVVRAEFGAVIQDLSSSGNQQGDGNEHTGWAILYLHIEPDDGIHTGTYLHAGDRIGHPSCEGGRANGTHVHIARKYNGEWVAAGGPLPFQLSGWVAHAGPNPYEGTLTMGEQTVIAHPYGSFETHISVTEDAR